MKIITVKDKVISNISDIKDEEGLYSGDYIIDPDWGRAPHGKGTWFKDYGDGGNGRTKTIIGSWDYGQLHGEIIIKKNEKNYNYNFKGTFSKGKILYGESESIETSNNNNFIRKISGDFINDGKGIGPHGKIKWISKGYPKHETSYHTYEGDYDKEYGMNGYGKMNFDNGKIYDGGWKRIKKHGLGFLLEPFNVNEDKLIKIKYGIWDENDEYETFSHEIEYKNYENYITRATEIGLEKIPLKYKDFYKEQLERLDIAYNYANIVKYEHYEKIKELLKRMQSGKKLPIFRFF